MTTSPSGIDPDIEVQIADTEGRLDQGKFYFKIVAIWTIVSAIGTATLVTAFFLGDQGAAAGVTAILIIVSPISLIVSLFTLRSQRNKLFDLERELKRLRAKRRTVDYRTGSTAAGQKRYQASRSKYWNEAWEYVEEARKGAAKNRRIHNTFQAVIILGSILVTSLTSAMAGSNPSNWITVVLSIMVTAAAGFSSYFKFRERGFNLQQTANSIEKESNSLDLRIRDYADDIDEDEAMRTYAERVEDLKEEQRNRELQLEQSPDRNTQAHMGSQPASATQTP
ncbi:DUF4231 domain-containing protein [Salinispora arenicola]|uniref:DUF4231 domain-containing protein n=1 Tax=Salinispora arenicola TaxID=168697 RepID=UPI001E344CA8|nr:DUF4231 domain-containing protein [Salinispora arenicola]